MKWIIMAVYNRWEWKELEKKLNGWLEEFKDREDYGLIIGGDFNVRTGELGGIGEAGMMRRSKDKTIGNGGRNFIEWVQEKGWYVMNGMIGNDWDGEYTYVGARGCTVIDYIIVNERAYDKVLDFKIKNRVDSDHMPLCLKLRKQEDMDEREPRVQEEERTRYKEIVVWDEESTERFNEKTESLDQPGYLEDGSIEERWQWLKKEATEAMVRKRIKIRKRKVGFKDWWDRGCTKQKRRVQRGGILWRKGRLSLEKYMMEKRKFKEFLIEKQKEKRERERSWN